MINKMNYRLRLLGLTLLVLIAGLRVFAEDKIYPDKPNPPRLVNDYAHMLSAGEDSRLESKLEEFARTTSTQISVVTIKNLGGHDVSEYTIEVFNRWGQEGKNNGVLLLVSLDDRKAWITVGKGLEGVLTDAKSGLIFRNELKPAFKEGRYFDGLNQSADAIIAVTKGEYKAEGLKQQRPRSATGIIVLVIFILIILRIFKGGGGGGGNYMSGRGLGNIATGMILGNMLGGGNRGGGGWGGGDFGGGGGGFGGFGGGSSGGGGAGGSW
jgi:uncharacterized protein